MAISIKHATQAVGIDATSNEIRKNQWNEEHTLTLATGRLLGRTTAGAGAVEEISVGANLTLSGGSLVAAASFPSGTKMPFQQTAAPTGWTKDLTHNNKALRLVNGTVGTGGTTVFTTVFASRTVTGTTDSTTQGGSVNNVTITGTIGNQTQGGTVGATTLTSGQLAAHTHSYNEASGAQTTLTGSGSSVRTTNTSQNTGSTGNNETHTHSFTGNAHNHSFTADSHGHTFTGVGHTHTFTSSALDMAVQYVDVIIATKD